MLRAERDSSKRPKTLAIVESLSQNIDSFRDFSKIEATELVFDILSGCAEAKRCQDPRILSGCEEILSRTRPIYRLVRNPNRLDEVTESPPGGMPDSVSLHDSVGNQGLSYDFLGEGAVTYDRFAVSRAERLFERYQQDKAMLSQRANPSFFPEPDPMEARAEGNTARKVPETIAGKTESPSNHNGFISPDSSELRATYLSTVPPSAEGLHERADFEKLKTSELMRFLHHSHWRVAARSAAVLRRRDSFEPKHLQLAFDVFHPAMPRRKAVIDRLRHMPDINIVPWVTLLMQDPQSEVRKKALAYASTCQNSEIRDLACRIAEGDSDPEIRKMASKVEIHSRK
jgi:hypothetical protein